MKKTALLFTVAVFMALYNWGQDCIPIGLEVERIDKNGKSRELLRYSFTYDGNNHLKEVVVMDNGITDDAITKHTLKFEQISLGKKITWFWNDEYESHYVITPNSFLVFEGDDNDDLNVDNADEYEIAFQGNLLSYIEFGRGYSETYTYEKNDVKQTEAKGKKGTYITEYIYADVPNPLSYLKELAYIEISVDNFIPLWVTLSDKIMASEKTTTIKEDTQETESRDYMHKVNSTGCPIEFVDQEKHDKVVYRISY